MQYKIIRKDSVQIILAAIITIISIPLFSAIAGQYSVSSPFSCGLNCSGSYELQEYTEEECLADPELCFNTIDGCKDGPLAVYEYVEDITITDLNDTVFKGGDTININALVDCDEDGDIVNIVYNNGSGWQNIHNYYCAINTQVNVYFNWTLDYVLGNHTIRVIIGYPGLEGATCAEETPGPKWSDNDDVSFFVNQSQHLTPPIVENATPSEGTVYELQEGLEILLCVDAFDDKGLSSVVANVSWTEQNEEVEFENFEGNTYCGTFLSGTSIDNYSVEYVATDNWNNVNNSVSTYFIINLTTNITIHSPLPNQVLPLGNITVNFTIDEGYDTSYMYYIVDGGDPETTPGGQKNFGFSLTDSEAQIGENTTAYANLSMSFKPSQNTSTNNASISLLKNGAGAANATLEIRTDNSGAPSSTIMAIGTVSPDLVSDENYSFVDIILNATIKLVENTTYWLFLNPANSSTETDFYTWESNNDGLYSFGNYSNNASLDLLFKIHDAYRYSTQVPDLEIGAHQITVYAASFTVADIQSPLVEFMIDQYAPSITAISHAPADKSSLDPGTQINITVNITDDTTIVGADVEYKKSTDPDFTIVDLTPDGDIFRANFTPDSEGIWTYRIEAWDSSENYIETEDTTINVTYEYNWTRSPDSFNATSAILNSNRSIGNITIANGADFPMAFNISRIDATSIQVFLNGTLNLTTVLLTPGSTAQIPVLVTAKNVISEDRIAIKIDPQNDSAVPDFNLTNFTFISYESGAFLNVEIIEYDPAVVQEQTRITLTARVTNVGNETANNITANWSIPTDWTARTNLSGEFNSLAAGSHVDFTRYININSDAETGNKTIIIAVNCTEGKYDTDQKDVIVSAIDPPQETPLPIVLGGGGGGRALIPAKKTVKAGISINSEIEIQSGSSSILNGTIMNQGETAISDIRLVLEGWPLNKHEILPETIQNIEPNRSVRFSIKITAPEYMGSEKQQARLVLEAKNGIEKYSIAKDLTIIIFKEDKEQSSNCFNDAKEIIAEAKSLGLNTLQAETDLMNAMDSFSKKEYGKSLIICNEIISGLEKGKKTAASLDELKTKYLELGSMIPEIQGMIALSEQAIAREDYDLASRRAEQAQMLLDAKEKEVQQTLPYKVNSIRQYAKEIIIFIIIAVITGIFIQSSIGLHATQKKMKSLKERKEEVLGRVQESQERYFVKKDMPQRIYEKEMAFHRDSLADIEKRHAELLLKKLKIVSGRAKKDLEKVKKETEEGKNELQKRYYVDKTIDHESYRKLHSGFESIIEDINQRIMLHNKK